MAPGLPLMRPRSSISPGDPRSILGDIAQSYDASSPPASRTMMFRRILLGERQGGLAPVRPRYISCPLGTGAPPTWPARIYGILPAC